SLSSRSLHSFPTRRSSDLDCVKSVVLFLFCNLLLIEIVMDRCFFAIFRCSDLIYESSRIVWIPALLFQRTACNHFFSTGIQTIRSEEHTSELQSRFDLVCR